MVSVKDEELYPSFLGFGSYDPVFFKESKPLLIMEKINQLALATIVGVATLLTAIAIGITFPISLTISIPTAILLETWCFNQISTALRTLQSIPTIAPSTHDLIPKEVETTVPPLEKWDETPLQCIPFKDSIETFKSKIELIKSAEKEILISGSYCGRQAFDEVLDTIEKRMEEKPELRVFILTATRFITDKNQFKCKNWEKIKRLSIKYPERFSTTFSYETSQVDLASSGFKYISNHAKFMVVDRKAMITGGSGIEDRWAYSDGLKPCKIYKESDFINASIAKTFRDKDFLFFNSQESDKKNLIDRSALEFYKLFARWNDYCLTHKKNNKHIKEIAEKKEILINSPQPLYQDLNLSEPGLDLKKYLSSIFNDRSISKTERTKAFMSGPEQTENTLEKELISLFDNAKDSIYINHMYFHPTEGLKNALISALQRGVKVKILTNDYNSKTPKAHRAFGFRSVYQARDVIRKSGKPLAFYTWDIENSTNHQKYIVIDKKYTLLGSSNLGYKGFTSMSDYEHNLLLESSSLSEELLSHFEEDLTYTKKYNDSDLNEPASYTEFMYNQAHIYFQDMIG